MSSLVSLYQIILLYGGDLSEGSLIDLVVMFFTPQNSYGVCPHTAVRSMAKTEARTVGHKCVMWLAFCCFQPAESQKNGHDRHSLSSYR